MKAKGSKKTARETKTYELELLPLPKGRRFDAALADRWLSECLRGFQRLAVRDDRGGMLGEDVQTMVAACIAATKGERVRFERGEFFTPQGRAQQVLEIAHAALLPTAHDPAPNVEGDAARVALAALVESTREELGAEIAAGWANVRPARPLAESALKTEAA